MKKTYIFLADGFEEIEALAVVDILRRGGIDVEMVSVSSRREVTAAHGVVVTADILLSQVAENDAVCLILPGGMPGAKNLAECPELVDMLQRHYDKGLFVAAICAAPGLVLSKLKFDRKLQLTGYPGFEGPLSQHRVLPDGVVVDGKVITAKGPAFAVKFGLTILKHIVSEKASDEVAAGMLL